MISFIVIGRNEGRLLANCFNSIITAIAQNKLNRYEIIYVDSNSEDKSIDIAKNYHQVFNYLLTSDYNAAIARNLGAEKSNGKVLFFIDGDMEIKYDFLNEVYCEKRGLKYDFVSGDFLNINYDYHGKYLNKEKYFNNRKVLIQQEVGGLFLIKRQHWFIINGMRVIFKRSQDIDLALRLATKKVVLKRLPITAAYHHTISYKDGWRKWEMIFNGDELFGRSLLYRKNLFNKYTYKRLVINDYSALILFLLIISLLFGIDHIILSFYLILITYRSIKNVLSNTSKALYSKIFNALDTILYYLVRDLTTVFGLLLFWPKTPKSINYKIISHEYPHSL